MTLSDNTEPSAEALEAANIILLESGCCFYGRRRPAISLALALDRFRAAGVREWLPIETLPDDVSHCWIGHRPSSTMLVARRDRYIPGIWRIMWSDRMVPWMPTCWMPLPEPPHDL